MDLRSLRYFLAIYEEGSISGAAQRCNVAQPSISLALRKLEEEIGVALFARSVRGVAPLPPAVDLAARARDILGDVARIAAEIGAHGANRIELRIFLDPTIALGKIAPLLRALCRTSDVALVSDRSVAEVVIAPSLGEKRERSLWQERYVLCLPPDHPLALRESIRVEDLAGIRLIARCSCERSHLLPRAVIRPEIVAEAHEEERVIALVEAGLGAAILPEFDAGSRRVVLRDVENFQISRTIAVSGVNTHVAAVERAYCQAGTP